MTQSDTAHYSSWKWNAKWVFCMCLSVYSTKASLLAKHLPCWFLGPLTWYHPRALTFGQLLQGEIRRQTSTHGSQSVWPDIGKCEHSHSHKMPRVISSSYKALAWTKQTTSEFVLHSGGTSWMIRYWLLQKKQTQRNAFAGFSPDVWSHLSTALTKSWSV